MHQTRTLPYMVINIFNDNYGLDFYYYAIESFLYMLIWFYIYDCDQRDYIPPTNTPDCKNRIMAIKTLTVTHNITYNALFNPFI